MDKKYFIVFSQKLAGYLMFNGHILIGLRKDKNNTNKNVFIFINSDELINTINNYKEL